MASKRRSMLGLRGLDLAQDARHQVAIVSHQYPSSLCRFGSQYTSFHPLPLRHRGLLRAADPLRDRALTDVQRFSELPQRADQIEQFPYYFRHG
jgi:hypothetical protein